VILFDLVAENEQHPVYQKLTIENGSRQYDFLQSVVGASLSVGRPFLSSLVLKALNFHAIACLHAYAGEYRPCEVTVRDAGGNVVHAPPYPYRVQALMDDFVNLVNREWENTDAVVLATYVLWRLNWIHPFINGNGRTARAACYFVLCLKAQQWLPGSTILPELIRREHVRYEAGLRHADQSGDISVLHALIADLVNEQLNTVPQQAATPQAPTIYPPYPRRPSKLPVLAITGPTYGVFKRRYSTPATRSAR
jgi:hypothetical protein